MFETLLISYIKSDQLRYVYVEDDSSYPFYVKVAFQLISDSSTCYFSSPNNEEIKQFSTDELLIVSTSVSSPGLAFSFPSEDCDIGNINYLSSRVAEKYFQEEFPTYVVHDSIGQTITIFSNECEAYTSLELDVTFIDSGENVTKSDNNTFLPCNVPLGVVVETPTISILNGNKSPLFSLPTGITRRSRLWELGGALLANIVILFFQVYIWYNKL